LMNVGYTTNVSGTSANMSIFSEECYDLSFYLLNKTFEGKLTFYLEDGQGNQISDQKSVNLKKDTDWKKYDGIVLTATQTIGGRLVILAQGVGEFNIDMVSLMPRAMYGANDPKWKYGGLRADLVAALEGLNPKFLRFPGGCVAEGAFDKDNHYNWKDTIGPIEERKENPNLWGYMQSYGLGYHEYFQLSEDLGAEPVPVIHAGILCQARSGDLMPMYPNTEDFEVLTQDILDLIEYANGDTSTEYGKKRAENGHKEPFDLKYVAIGNENFGAQYWNNFNVLKKAVLAVYPEMTIITSAGPHSEGWIYDEAWNNVYLKHKDTYVDEHYYNTPQWFLDHTDRYDTYSRESAKVFIGEFAAHADPTTTGRPNTLYTALTEGAYLTGIERNSDVVKMISYAPLLARVGATQWTPDLIFFDSHEVMLTPNYYVLELFSNHIGTRYLNTELTSDLNLSQSVTVDERKEELYIKVVNPTDDATVLEMKLSQFENMLPQGEWMVIHHENKEA
ncbi:MAG: alpha-L-arabinofuranosidase C-terminal domain-containing protein, partial [Turicibacter sp.]